MSPVSRRTLTLAVVVAIVLFFVPWVLRMAGAQGIADPCALLWTPTTGIVEMCHKTYLPILAHCADCMSAWPVWPDGSVAP